MSVAYNPRIVTDGLVLYLDAGNAKSYPGSGTQWLDLSGLGNHATLVNGPTFSGGSMVFAGANDYGVVSNNIDLSSTSAVTYCAWVKTTQSNTAIWCEHSVDFNSNPNAFLVDLGESGGAGSFQFSDRGSNGYNIVYTTPGYNDNTWHYFSATSDRSLTASAQISLYVDAVYDTILHPSYRSNNSNNYSSFPFYIASRAGAGYFSICNMGVVHLYNRALTQAEILQNFNALRGRYGI